MRVLAVLCVLLMAAPAMAEVSTALPTSGELTLSTYNSVSGEITPGMGGPRGTSIYADLVTSGSYINQGTTATYPLPVGDDLHATGGGTVTAFQMGYYIPGTIGTYNITYTFWPGDATDSDPPGYGGAASIASYLLTGLPAGANAFNVTGVSVPVGADFYIECDFAGNGIATGGPLITDNSGGTVGYSHNYFTQTGSLWSFGGTNPPWADFYLGADIVPEPTTMGLLALGGLLALRRRK